MISALVVVLYSVCSASDHCALKLNRIVLSRHI